MLSLLTSIDIDEIKKQMDIQDSELVSINTGELIDIFTNIKTKVLNNVNNNYKKPDSEEIFEKLVITETISVLSEYLTSVSADTWDKVYIVLMDIDPDMARYAVGCILQEMTDKVNPVIALTIVKSFAAVSKSISDVAEEAVAGIEESQ